MKHLILILTFLLTIIFTCSAQSITETVKKIESYVLEGKVPTIENTEFEFITNHRSITWNGTSKDVDLDCESFKDYITISKELSLLGYDMFDMYLTQKCIVGYHVPYMDFVNCTKKITLKISFLLERESYNSFIPKTTIVMVWQNENYEWQFAPNWCD